ncbi:MAG: transglutaminase family protein [Leptospiraceae bacterium]|nr:transglutaminase family protein [Leptospiraceae bacterium]
MIEFHVTHKTVYEYSELVSHCHNEARISIRSLPGQKCFTTAIYVTPRPVMFQERVDYFGNRVAYFAIEEPHSVLEVEAISRVEIDLNHRPYPIESRSWEETANLLEHDPGEELALVRQFMVPSPHVEISHELRQYALQFFPPGSNFLDCVNNLNRSIFETFEYDPKFSTISTPVHEVLHARRGVCQDFSHLALALLRSLGFAGRYVSGYLETLPPPGQPKLQGADASHAWFSIYEPVSNLWVDFDPTNGVRCGETHIIAAWGRDYSDVSPIRGVLFGGGAHKIHVGVDVTRLAQTNNI